MNSTQQALALHRADSLLLSRDGRPWKETMHQQTIFHWATFMVVIRPELKWLYAVPNGMYTTEASAGRAKGEGLKSGVFDIGLDIARGGFHGLKIEMKVPATVHEGKRVAKGVISDNQLEWYEHYKKQGYRAEFCYGFRPAIDTILEYLDS